MRRRRNPCDLCGHERQRWQRLCDVCWRQLPGAIRTGIVEAHRLGRKAEGRAWKRQALQLMADRVVRHVARTAAMLGEHP